MTQKPLVLIEYLHCWKEAPETSHPNRYWKFGGREQLVPLFELARKHKATLLLVNYRHEHEPVRIITVTGVGEKGMKSASNTMPRTLFKAWLERLKETHHVTGKKSINKINLKKEMTKENLRILKSYYKAGILEKARILRANGCKTQDELYNALGYDRKDPISKLIAGITGSKPLTGTTKKSPAVDVAVSTGKDQPVDYVVAFDTTGSMNAYINNVKKHVKDLIPRLFKDTPNLKMRIIAFGDYCDMNAPNDYGKALQSIQLTDNENALIEFVQNAKATGGGDGDEFYELVINKINQETDWRPGSKKNVLFIGDCDPHKVGYSYQPFVTNAQIDWRKEAQDAARYGIQYDTLRIHPNVEWYAELSRMTEGACMNFSNANKMDNIMEATTAVRYNKEKFRCMSLAATRSGDAELIGAYKTMSDTLL